MGFGKTMDLPTCFGAVVPIYVAIGVAFVWVCWWKILTPEQCGGIKKFVVEFALPFLVLDLLTSNNPYTMNFIVLAADSLQKLVILAALLLWNSLSKNGSFEWVITLFGLSTLPNTLFIGLPVIQSFYGESNSNLLIQIMVVQGVIWFNVLLAMYEYRAARLLISGQFPNTAGSIASVVVDPEVVSLSDREGLETNAEIGADGKLHVMVRTSSASSRLSMDSFISVLSELNSRATDSFSRKSSKRGGSLTSAASFYGSASEGKFHRNGSNSSRVASFDFEVIAEDSETSVQQETASQSLDGGDEGKKEMPPAGVVTRLILIIMWRTLIRNPNTYASVVGLTWSLIAFRFVHCSPTKDHGL